MVCTLAQPSEYDSTVCVRRRCDLMSKYFGCLLLLPITLWSRYVLQPLCCVNYVSMWVFARYLSDEMTS